MEQTKLIMTGIHLDLTEANKTKVEEKMEKLFHHSPDIDRIRVEVELDAHHSNHEEFIAKGHIEMRGKPLVATEQADSFNKAIDSMTDKLDRMLRRRSHKKTTLRKHPHAVEINADLPNLDKTDV